MFKKVTLSFFINCFCALAFAGETPVPARLEKILKTYSAVNQFSGNVLLSQNGKIVYEHSFGQSSYQQNAANTSQTQFNIGSMGKMFTAVAIMQLVEKGKLDLQAPVKTYLPEYGLPNADKINLTHLLTHTSGYGTYMRAKGFDGKKDLSLDEVVKIIASQPLQFDEPGKGNAYSNSAFVIMGRIIEKASGLSWMEYFRKNIFMPAGMKNTLRYLPGVEAPNKAHGYTFSSTGVYQDQTAKDPMPYSDGGLFSTARDLNAFLIALQTHKLLSAASFAKMTKEYAHLDMINCEMGLGWEISKVEDVNVIAKGGNVIGFSGQMAMLPGGYNLVLTSNQGIVALLIFENVLKAMYGLPAEEPRMATGNFIYQQIRAKGWADIKANLEEILKQNNYTLFPRDLTWLAKDLKAKNEYTLAIDILNYVVEKNPSYQFGWDELADAYLQVKDNKNALRCYGMLLYLDPAGSAIDEIKKISIN